MSDTRRDRDQTDQPGERRRMSKTEYEKGLDALGLSNRAFCHEIAGVTARSGRAWKAGEMPVPGSIAAVIRIALALKLKPDRLRQLVQYRGE